MPASAEQLYAAFRSVCPVDENGEQLLPLEALADGGRGWFAIANALAEISKPAADLPEPYEVDLVPIPPRIDPDDGLEIVESEDERPTKITIRGFKASDLCVRQTDDRMMHAILAKATGIDLDTIEWRMHPSDVDGAIALCTEANGDDAADLCRAAYFDGGGEQEIARCPALAWEAVAAALLTEIEGDVARVRCRTPGIGVLQMGPLRAGHLRMHRGTAQAETEWMGRLVAMAKACNRAVGQMLALRPEDALHAWAAFEDLKKKAERPQNTAIASRLFGTSSPATAAKNSTT